jgi:hypothetical protein
LAPQEIMPQVVDVIVPGGGSNPPDRKGRRILSPIFGILQCAAFLRKNMHISFIYNIYIIVLDCIVMQ